MFKDILFFDTISRRYLTGEQIASEYSGIDEIYRDTYGCLWYADEIALEVSRGTKAFQ